MRKRVTWTYGLCGALAVSCSPHSDSADASNGTMMGAGQGSLAGTWNLTTTSTAGPPVLTTVTVGQDSLDITSPDFTLTATRMGNVLTFTDNAPPSNLANSASLTATQTAGSFNAGIVPFNLGGSWAMDAGPKGKSPTVTCMLDVSPTEIDGACQQVSPASPWFIFTMKKMAAASSSFGDFGGTWVNTWTTPGTNGGTFPCTIDFTGNTITSCSGGPVNGQVSGSPLAGITATYDGANTVSGAAHGWAEFSATR